MTDNDSSANNPQAPVDDNPLISDAERWAIWQPAAELGRKRAASAKPEPLTEFDRTFFTVVEPKLIPFVTAGAFMAQQGIETFSQAHDRVIDMARTYGALHLSEAGFFQLDSWIDRALLACLNEPPADGVVSPARLAKITGEPRR